LSSALRYTLLTPLPAPVIADLICCNDCWRNLRTILKTPPLLAIAAVATAYLPARRAMRIETAAAFRIE
jgi:hypothetical protein